MDEEEVIRRGHETVRLGDRSEAWEELEISPEQVVTRASGTVVAVRRLRATARSGGATVETRTAHASAFRCGPVHRRRTYADPVEALA